VIDLRNMALWSIGFIANRYRIPPTKLACVRYCWQPVLILITLNTTFLMQVVFSATLSRLLPLQLGFERFHYF